MVAPTCAAGGLAGVSTVTSAGMIWRASVLLNWVIMLVSGLLAPLPGSDVLLVAGKFVEVIR